jgi:hypothetical protein
VLPGKSELWILIAGQLGAGDMGTQPRPNIVFILCDNGGLG